MISKAKIKYIRSLELKKNRSKEGMFIAEGPKVVGDLLHIQPAHLLAATREWIEDNANAQADEIFEVSEEELKRISFLQHPQQVIAVFPKESDDMPVFDNSQLYLALDGIQDPGNLGTIIRVADWFGITTIFCSEDTADLYNPKVVQATMGSIARVHTVYCDLNRLFDSIPTETPVYGTLLDGEDIYKKHLSSHGIIVMGNEGKGISPSIRGKINQKLLIPNYPKGRKTADSLNVAIATAITCFEFRKNGN